jgi:hypothetical protein
MRAILLAASMALCAAADWNAKPFTAWSQEVARRVLTDSPWTRPKTVSLEWREREQRQITYKDIPGADPSRNTGALGPLGGINPPKTKNRLEDKAGILIRWSSALPIRHATAVFQHHESNGKESINSLIPAPPSDYVLELYGLPLEMGHGGTGLVESIVKESALLRLKNGRVIRPSKVNVLVQSSLKIEIHFHPAEPITVADQELEFSADLRIFSVRERFRLAPMVYMGRLEL